MRITSAFALAAALSVQSASANAQAAQAAGAGEGVGPTKESTVPKFVDFNDENSMIVDEYAKTNGIDRKEAFKQLRAMRRGDRLEERLQRQFGDDFVSIQYIHNNGRLRVKVVKANHRNTDAGNARASAAAENIDYDVETAATPLTRSGYDKLERDVAAKLKSIDPTAHFELDRGTGALTILSKLPIDKSAFSFAPSTVEVRADFQIILASNAMAGSSHNHQVSTTETGICTMGFKTTYNGTVGIITAGHCGDSPTKFDPYYDSHYSSSTGSKLNFVRQWISGGLDVQFHTLAETDDAVLAYYWDGSVSKPIYSVATTYPKAGDYYCWWGRATHKQLCGYVGTTTFNSAIYGTPFYRVLSSGRGPLAITGDSGGPVTMGSEAKGIIHAYDGVSGDLYFNDMQNMRVKAGLAFHYQTP